MVKEIVMYTILPENSSAFEQSYKDVSPILRRQQGYLNDMLLHGIENPESYILEVEWQDLQSHQVFIASDDHPKLTGPLRRYVVEAKLAHYNITE